MTPAPSRPIAAFKAPSKPKSGSVTGGHEIERSERSGEKTLIGGDSRSIVVPPRTGQAMIGLGMGVTIPGPKGSYLSARIDAQCYLPCEPNAESIRKTYAEAGDRVQEQLMQDGRTVELFFKDWAGR